MSLVVWATNVKIRQKKERVDRGDSCGPCVLLGAVEIKTGLVPVATLFAGIRMVGDWRGLSTGGADPSCTALPMA